MVVNATDGALIAATLMPGGMLKMAAVHPIHLQPPAVPLRPSVALPHKHLGNPMTASVAFGLGSHRVMSNSSKSTWTMQDPRFHGRLGDEPRKRLMRRDPRRHASDKYRPLLGGAVLQLVARVFAAIGLIMQRSALDDDAFMMLRRVGITVYVSTIVPDMASYLLAPPKLVLLLSSVEPLVLALLTSLLLPQDAAFMTSRKIVAIALCSGGILGYAIFAPGTADGVVVGANSLPGAAPTVHGVVPYLTTMIACLIYFAWQARKRHLEIEFSGVAPRLFWSFPMTAAIALVLQRLAVAMLGSSGSLALWATGVRLKFSLALACMLCCSFHVCRGVALAPAYILVATYYSISMLLQLFQSMILLREFRDEPMEKSLIACACVLVSLAGLFQLHWSQEEGKATRFNASKLGPLKPASPQAKTYTVDSMEAIEFPAEVHEPNPNIKLPSWTLAGVYFLGRA
jgi:hypothetical protein